MKTGVFSIWLAITVSSILFQSCCKGYCSDETIFAIDFAGFTPVELEKIKIVRYNDNAALDSYYVSNNNIIRKDTSRVYPDTPLRSDHEYRIILENAGPGYEITDIETKKEDCNCGSGTYNTITAYSLNGVRFRPENINPLMIRK